MKTHNNASYQIDPAEPEGPLGRAGSLRGGTGDDR
jgi:hypothetical protein